MPPPASRNLIAAKTIVHALALTPAVVLGWRIWREYNGADGGFGADPVAYIEHDLGLWALRFLLITLAITPLRQLSGQAVLIRFRRMLGLYAFVYATLHFTAYLVLDLGGYWTQIVEEIVKRPYITVGFTAWLLLVPLAATSTTAAIRKLGRNWARLHMLVYPIAVLAVLHFWWIVKSDVREPLTYALILALLLGSRVYKRVQGRRRASQARPASA